MTTNDHPSAPDDLRVEAVTLGAALIAAERQRQIEVEGWTLDHDVEHGPDALCLAAAAYRYGQSGFWPWDREWWKPKDHLTNLVRSGALFRAALDVIEAGGILRANGTQPERQLAEVTTSIDAILAAALPVLAVDRDDLRAEAVARATRLTVTINDISSLIDVQYPEDIGVEAHRWRRCMKVAEEVGEVTEALLGMVGENPRKGQTHTVIDVHAELLDVALAALGAVAHLEGNSGDPVSSLMHHATFVRDRLSTAIEGATDV